MSRTIHCQRSAFNSRSAFTLLELLVLVTVVAVLVGAAFPAIQSGREQARRSRCASNLHRYVGAVLNYHDTHVSFPHGSGGPGSPSTTETLRHDHHWNTVLAVLPFAGEAARFEQWTAMQRKFRGRCLPPWNNTKLADSYSLFYSESIDVFLCPSDTSAREPMTWLSEHAAPHARSSYATCRGDLIENNYSDEKAETIHTRSVFGRRVYFRTSDVADGLSNTLALSERLVASSATTRKAVESVAVSKRFMYEPDLCDLLREGDEFPETQTMSVRETGLLFSGMPYHGGFSTVLPPNRSSCANVRLHAFGVFPPSSRHPGGVLGAKLDGSVSFFSNGIDCGNTARSPGGTAEKPTSPEKPKKESNYGVWGALGTRAGNRYDKSLDLH